MRHLTHSRFNSPPFAGAATSHQNVSDREAGEQHTGIRDKCHTLYGNHAALYQGPNEGGYCNGCHIPPQQRFRQRFIQFLFTFLAQVHGQHIRNIQGGNRERHRRRSTQNYGIR